VQDTAYQSLLKRKRREYHEQIATVLSEQFPEMKESQPELLAHHYSEAGLAAHAIPYWQQAGQRATERSAHTEAIAHLTMGLEALDALPDTPERAQHELQLQLTLILPLQATKSHAAEETEHACARALELCRQRGGILDETPELFRALRGLLAFYAVRGEFRTARELAEQLLELAHRSDEPALLLQAHQTFGFVLYSLGEIASAQVHFEETIALYDPQKHHPHVLGTVDDSRVVAKGQLASTLWRLGYPDQARTRSYAAVELAEELSHPFSLAVALIGVAVVHCLRREGYHAKEHAEALVKLSTEQRFEQWLATANICVGYTLTELGPVEQGIAQMREGVQAKAAMGIRMGLPFYLALLAEGFARARHADEGLAVVAEALELIAKTDQRVDEAELYRLKGEMTLQSCGEHPASAFEREAQACFEQALDIAGEQSAKSWELRAATSLARLWQQQDKQGEAHELLSGIYNWFTEGFDTKDLQDAKALLEELG
jgi:predicted ATPase